MNDHPKEQESAMSKTGLLAVISGWLCLGGAAVPAGQILWLERDGLRMAVAPDFGGRIVAFQLADGPNVLKAVPERWNDPARQSFQPDQPYRQFYGHITLPSPQDRWWTDQEFDLKRKGSSETWPPDPFLVDAPYRVLERTADFIRLEGPDSPVSGVRLRKEMRLLPGGAAVVSVTMTNGSGKPRQWGLWTISALPADAVCFAPIPDGSRFRFAFQTWDSGKEDPIGYALENGLFSFAATPAGSPAVSGKAFLYTERRLIAAFVDGCLFIKSAPPLASRLVHPQQAGVELYKKVRPPPEDSYIEAEFQGAYTLLQPGESATLEEHWELRKTRAATRQEMTREVLDAANAVPAAPPPPPAAVP